MQNEFLFEDQIRFRIINGEHYRFGRSKDAKEWAGVTVWADKVVWHDDPTTLSGQNFEWVRVHTWGRNITLHEVHYRAAV